mgnify:CR=1 FL=1
MSGAPAAAAMRAAGRPKRKKPLCSGFWLGR